MGHIQEATIEVDCAAEEFPAQLELAWEVGCAIRKESGGNAVTVFAPSTDALNHVKDIFTGDPNELPDPPESVDGPGPADEDEGDSPDED